MRFVAIEFESKSNNTHVHGYLRIPDNFIHWTIGFSEYLRDKYKAKNISIYPLNVSIDSYIVSCDKTAKNMEDDFILALRSNIYYPESINSSILRYQWASMDPSTSSFTVKER